MLNVLNIQGCNTAPYHEELCAVIKHGASIHSTV